MAFNYIVPLLDTTCPQPKKGCGLNYCFEETAYLITAGTKSKLDIVLGIFGVVSVGDTVNIHGFIFTFVASVPSNLQQVQIAGLSTYLNLFAQMVQIPFFADNYTITTPSVGRVLIIANTNQLDANYYLLASTTNISAIILNPFGSQTQGTENVYKEEYYVYCDIYDNSAVPAAPFKICQQPFAIPLNILQNNKTKVCFNVQALLGSYAQIFTSPPAPYNTNNYPNTLANLDINYFRKFYFRFYAAYNSNTGGCSRSIIANYRLPIAPDSLTLANFVQQTDEPNGFFPYSFACNLGTGDQLFITNMPQGYKICPSTPFELRWDAPAETISLLGGNTYIEFNVFYKNGSTNLVTYALVFPKDGCQVINGNLVYGYLQTLNTSPIDKIEFKTFYQLVGSPIPICQAYTIYFDFSKSNDCCGAGGNVFYFVGTHGNNDVVIGNKTTEQNLEVDFLDFCKEQICGDNYSGTNQQQGEANADLNTESKVYKCLIEIDRQFADYLDNFLISPIKYWYDAQSQTVYRIKPAQSSYKIYDSVNAGKMKIIFTWQRAMMRQIINQ